MPPRTDEPHPTRHHSLRGLAGASVLLGVLLGAATGCGAPRDPQEKAIEMARVSEAITQTLPAVTDARVHTWMNGFVESVSVDLTLRTRQPLSIDDLKTLNTVICENISWEANGVLIDADWAQDPTVDVDLSTVIDETPNTDPYDSPTSHPGGDVWLDGCAT